MKKIFIAALLMTLAPVAARAECHAVYIVGQGYTEVCTEDPLPTYPEPSLPCAPAAGDCE